MTPVRAAIRNVGLLLQMRIKDDALVLSRSLPHSFGRFTRAQTCIYKYLAIAAAQREHFVPSNSTSRYFLGAIRNDALLYVFAPCLSLSPLCPQILVRPRPALAQFVRRA
jgi:hypothetical protein